MPIQPPSVPPTPPPSERHTTFQSGALPPLAWSFSRHRLLETCERAVYWQYDGSQRGYAAPPASDARRAWTLKHLTSLPLLLGNAIHQAARTLLLALRDGTEPPSVDLARETARAMLNQVWFTSTRQQDRFWAMPGVFTAFREVVYRGALSDVEVNRARERLRTCLATLYAAPVLADVGTALASAVSGIGGPTLHVSNGLPASFTIADGTTVWADLDLGYRTWHQQPHGFNVPTTPIWCIADFKTGAPAADELLQLATYGLYSRDVLRIPMTDGTYLGRVVDLARAQDRWLRITEDLVDGVPAIIAKDVGRMQALRAAADCEPKRRASAYALASDRRSCGRCNYLLLCQDELRRLRSRVGQMPITTDADPRVAVERTAPEASQVAEVPGDVDGAGTTENPSLSSPPECRPVGPAPAWSRRRCSAGPS